MKHYQSLRTKFVAVLILLGLGPLLIMGGLAWSAVLATHQQDVATMEVQLLDQKSAEIQKFFSDVSGLFDIHVGYEQTSIIAKSDQQFLLEKLLSENQYILEASFVDLLGNETAKNSRIQDTSLSPLQDLSLLPAFTAAKSGGHYLGPVHYTSSGPIITLSGPVVNRNGQVIMVIVGQISLSPLLKLVNFANLGTSGYVYVTDESGTVLASANSQLLGKNFHNDLWIKDILSGQRHNGLGGKDLRINFAGEEVLSAGQPLKNLNWAIVAEWQKADAFSVVKQIQNEIIYFSLVIMFLVLLLGWLLGLSVLKPLSRLQLAASKIGSGVFDFKTEITTGDELEQLGEVFDNMALDLKRLAELKEEFVYIAAHELRTPVTAIKGYLSMVSGGEAGPISAEAKDLITRVQGANQRLIQLVEDLLQVARSESGRLVISVAAINMQPAVESVLLELEPLAKEKNIKLQYSPLEHMPLINADADRLKEVLINLVGNAIKYTLGSGAVTIMHEVQGGDFVTHIQDMGIGMSPQEQEKLFEKFYRIKNESTAKISGTGLGLFIVKQIIEKMNGKIWATSQKGKGSVFSFSLPLSGK